MALKIQDSVPLMIYDNECYVCVQFAKLVNYLAKGRLYLVGHYTDFGKDLRDNFLDSSALKMFWFIDNKTAYGGIVENRRDRMKITEGILRRVIRSEIKKTLIKESSPGFTKREFGDPLPTFKDVSRFNKEPISTILRFDFDKVSLDADIANQFFVFFFPFLIIVKHIPLQLIDEPIFNF